MPAQTNTYIRWDTRKPSATHRSRNHASGQMEAGMSVEPVRGSGTKALALAVGEYGGQYIGSGARCWIVTGTECGTGSDSEPLLTGVSVIREVPPDEIHRLMRISSALNRVHMAAAMWRKRHSGAPRTAAEWRMALEQEHSMWVRS